MSRCYICDGHTRCQGAMCSKCARSFKRSLDRQRVCLFDAMAWAANRVRKLERQRVSEAEVGHG